jgi:NADH-quinone oxidoreductase subunit L
MVVPLVALAVASLVAGIINTPGRLGFERFLEPSFEGVELAHAPAAGAQWVLAIVSVLAGLAGLAYATRRYFFRPAPPEQSDTWRWVRNGYYVDNLYGDVLVRPGELGAAWAAFVADQRGLDGIVNGVGWLVRRLGALLRPLQSGFVRSYGAAMMIGTVVVLLWLVSRAGL